MWNPNQTGKVVREVLGLAKGNPVLAGLDIGTSKIAVVIAAAGRSSLELIAAGDSPSVGVDKGVITDPDIVARCIVRALGKARETAGFETAALAFVGYNGPGTKVQDCRSVVNEEILQLIPPHLMREGINKGVKYGARAITAPPDDILKIVESTRLAGLKVQNILYGPGAGSLVLLSRTERELGTLLVDIGAGTTSVSIFDRGELRETCVIPVGGEHLAADLAVGLRISINEAENILKNYGVNEADHSLGVSIPIKSGLLPCAPVRAIIEARLTEIIELVAAAINDFNYYGLLSGGAVFSGGVSRLNGLSEIAENRLQLPVRTGLRDNAGFNQGTVYANALGLVKQGYVLYRENQYVNELRDRFRNKFFSWF
jgi:cell division protein FtsA